MNDTIATHAYVPLNVRCPMNADLVAVDLSAGHVHDVSLVKGVLLGGSKVWCWVTRVTYMELVGG